MKYDFLVLFPLPPARLASYRESFSNSGAKDDPTDAALLVDYLLRHRRVHRPGVRHRDQHGVGLPTEMLGPRLPHRATPSVGRAEDEEHGASHRRLRRPHRVEDLNVRVR